MDLETEAKPRFLNHEEPRARLLTDLEDGSFADVIRLIAIYILDLVDFNCGFDISLQHHDNIIIESHNHNEYPLLYKDTKLLG